MLEWFTDFFDALVPIVAILGAFGTPLIVAMLYFRYLNLREQRLADTLQSIINTNQEIPVELLDRMMGAIKDDPHYSVRRGVMMTSLGIGVGLFGWVGTNSLSVVGIGLLIVCIGLGYLVFARVRGNDDLAAD